jgi:G3E family GTPase
LISFTGLVHPAPIKITNVYHFIFSGNKLNTVIGDIDFEQIGKDFGDFVSEMVNYGTLVALNFEDMILEAKVFAAR